MKKIYFVRHAESQANATGIMAGREWETPLTKKGEQQAKEAGQFLKDKGIELMMVSPMERTRKTAAIIAEEIGLSKSKLIENELIMEQGMGKYSGQPYAAYAEAKKMGTLDLTQIESAKELFDRVAKAFDWLAARPESTILVVSHGATGRMFRTVDRKLSHDDFRTMERFGNAEIDQFTI